MPFMKDGKRDYARETAWNRERHKIISVRLQKEHEEKLQSVIAAKDTTIAEWVRDMIEKEYEKLIVQV